MGQDGILGTQCLAVPENMLHPTCLSFHYTHFHNLEFYLGVSLGTL